MGVYFIFMHASWLSSVPSLFPFQMLIEKIQEGLRAVETRIQAMQLLLYVVDRQPPWTHRLVDRPIFPVLLKCLKVSTPPYPPPPPSLLNPLHPPTSHPPPPPPPCLPPPHCPPPLLHPPWTDRLMDRPIFPVLLKCLKVSTAHQTTHTTHHHPHPCSTPLHPPPPPHTHHHHHHPAPLHQAAPLPSSTHPEQTA